MPIFERIWLAALTRNADDAGSDGALNLTINIDGEDVLDSDYDDESARAEGTIFHPMLLDPPVDLSAVTNSSVRVGLRSDDAWGPQHILVVGEALPDFAPGRTLAIAMESDLSEWLSTDPGEGPLTLPLRLVSPGDSSTPIHRLVMLVHTAWSTFYGDSETDSAIELEVTAGGNVVLRHEIADTAQPDLARGVTNWYEAPALVPFTRGEILANGKITLSILGSDAWRPFRLFLFGLDTPAGRPNAVVTLATEHVWGHGWMSTDTGEGVASVDLEVVSV